MSDKTEELISALAAGLQPVRRLRPPLRRAGGWLLAMLAVAVVLAVGGVDFAHLRQRAGELGVRLELLSTLLTAATTVIAAFYLSIPGRSRAWLLTPLPPLLLWLAASAYICVEHPHPSDPGVTDWDAGPSCFVFIVLVGTPMLAVLLWSLQRARPLLPNLVAIAAALAASAFAAFLLELFHQREEVLVDILMHWAAVVLVTVGGVGLSRVFLRWEARGR